jgi:hypothetical protein
MLEDAGVVGPAVGAGPRQIIMEEMEIQALLQSESDTSEETIAEVEMPQEVPEEIEHISYELETEEETI